MGQLSVGGSEEEDGSGQKTQSPEVTGLGVTQHPQVIHPHPRPGGSHQPPGFKTAFSTLPLALSALWKGQEDGAPQALSLRLVPWG